MTMNQIHAKLQKVKYVLGKLSRLLKWCQYECVTVILLTVYPQTELF